MYDFKKLIWFESATLIREMACVTKVSDESPGPLVFICYTKGLNDRFDPVLNVMISSF